MSGIFFEHNYAIPSPLPDFVSVLAKRIPLMEFMTSYKHLKNNLRQLDDSQHHSSAIIDLGRPKLRRLVSVGVYQM
jgi:hypothetical protein